MNKMFSRMLEPRFRLCFVMLLIFAAVSFYFEPIVAIAELVITALVYGIFRVSFLRRNREIVKYVENMMVNVDAATKESLLNSPLPMAIVKLDSDELIWYNNEFTALTNSHENLFETQIHDVLPGVSLHWLVEGKHQCDEDVQIGERRFNLIGNLVRSESDKNTDVLAVIYFIEVTDLRKIEKEHKDTKQIVSILLIDNFDELLNGVDDANRNAILAAIDEKIAKWIEPAQGIIIKSERDRYMFIFQNQHYETYKNGKFALLDAVREVQSINGVTATMTIGVGKDGGNFYENYKNAQLAIEMSLSRGGDQVVIRDSLQFEFYGGRSEGVEKRTKVKSRVMSNALSELIKDASEIFVMGHQNSDNDSIGAAIGILAMARKLGKRGNIVLKTTENNAESLCERIVQEEYYKDVFISPEDAMISADKDTLLVVVDTNRPEYVESVALLESINKVAVIDHHRRSAEYIKNPLLNFHEPYASSACELVTELLQYVMDKPEFLKCEAEALLAGIVLDTKNFTMKTGVRTFEAAAYLRRGGADTVAVKRLLQNDLEDYVLRAQIVNCARIYKNSIAIARFDGAADRICAAQAADELLNITKVQASFVLYKDGNRIIISARSLGNVNVQLILEKLGGGGHLATAGAQIQGKSMDEVMEELVSAIDLVVDDE